ncbi:MAG: hypothetical protein RIC55_24655 [Pirellulaceae bacterium]
MAETTTAKKKRVRSPAYPALNLETAIERAAAIYEHEKRHAAPVAVVAQHWGTTIKNSSGLRGIAALKQFGLIIEEGSGDDRHVRLSGRALDILIPETANSPEHQQAIRDAALSPKIHKKLWEHYQGHLPSDASLKSHLVRQHEFNDSHVQGFIKQFRETVNFARLNGADEISPQEEDDANGSAADDFTHETIERGAQMAARNQAPTTTHDPSGPCIVFPLSGGNVVEIRLRRKVSPKDFERIRQLVDLSEHSLVDYDDEEAEVDELERVAR